MRVCRSIVSIAAVAVACLCTSVRAATTVDDLRKEVEDLRKRISSKERDTSPIRSVDSAMDSKYGPNAQVTTKAGKLEIGGLLQIWNYSIQDSRNDVFDDEGTFAGSGGTSEAIDNNGYRIRRSELRFTLSIHENITAVIQIDPAREATSFAPLPSNQGLFKSQRENPSIALDTPIANTSVGRVQTGAGAANRMLEDAYINYHGFVPKHDFTIGQFKPPMGEEGTRNSAYLDFAERAMVTQINDERDIGVQAHGTWWNDRFQYWLALFNTPGNFFGTANSAAEPRGSAQFGNRSDDNDAKDFVARVLIRPIWGAEDGCTNWGFLELGASGQVGTHGESGDRTGDGSGPINGLNRLETNAIRSAAWIYYKPVGIVRGWWMRGEAGYHKDRTVPNSVNVFGLGSGPNGEQAAPNPFSRTGFYVSTGYKLTDSLFAERLAGGGFFNNLLQPVEFVFRYERFENIISEDLVAPDIRSDQFKTSVFTAGVNYYIKAYNMRVQLNYMQVNEQEDNINQPARGFTEVKNNVLIFTYQVNF
jgi:hypothetical protein